MVQRSFEEMMRDPSSLTVDEFRDITCEQIGSLSAQQLNKFPVRILNSISALQMSSINVRVISELNVHDFILELSPDGIRGITQDQMKEFSFASIAQFTSYVWNGLSEDVISGMSNGQVQAISIQTIPHLNEYFFRALGQKLVCFTTDQVPMIPLNIIDQWSSNFFATLPIEFLNSCISEQIKSFKSAQVNALPVKTFVKLNKTILSNLSLAVVSGLTANQANIPNVNNALDEYVHVQDFSREAIPHIPAQFLARLPREAVGEFESDTVQLFQDPQLNVLVHYMKDFKPEVIRDLKERVLKFLRDDCCFTEEQFVQIHPEVIATIPPQNIKYFPAYYFNSLPDDAINKLTSEQLAAIEPLTFNNLSIRFLNNLSSDALTGLTEEHCEYLAPKDGLEPFFRKVNKRIASYLKIGPNWSCFTENNISWLSGDAVSGLNLDILRTLSMKTVLKFTQEQVKHIDVERINQLGINFLSRFNDDALRGFAENLNQFQPDLSRYINNRLNPQENARADNKRTYKNNKKTPFQDFEKVNPGYETRTVALTSTFPPNKNAFDTQLSPPHAVRGNKPAAEAGGGAAAAAPTSPLDSPLGKSPSDTNPGLEQYETPESDTGTIGECFEKLSKVQKELEVQKEQKVLDHAILNCMMRCRDYHEHLTKSSDQSSDLLQTKKKIVNDAYQILDRLLSEAPAEPLKGKGKLEIHPTGQSHPTQSNVNQYSVRIPENTLKNISVEKKKQALNDFKKHLFGEAGENLKTLQKDRDHAIIRILGEILRALRWVTKWFTGDNIDRFSIFTTKGDVLYKKVDIEVQRVVNINAPPK